MSTQIILTCDRCGKHVENRDQFWEVRISFGSKNAFDSNPYKRVDWCRPCMVENHMLGNNAEVAAREPEQKPPTFEELFREIVREVVAESN